MESLTLRYDPMGNSPRCPARANTTLVVLVSSLAELGQGPTNICFDSKIFLQTELRMVYCYVFNS